LSKVFKAIVAAVIAIFAIGGLAACSSADKVSMEGVTSLIDVRTAGEYAAGHLQGAINMDVEATTFADQVQTLDKAGKYLVYCHSGRRAGIAVDNMKSLGFSDVTNIGGIDAASAATSLPIVQ
jgi:rhodanese-related sulfurtransferase